MVSTRRVRRAAIVGGLGALLGLQMVAGAAVVGAQSSTGGHIRPNQVFAALVNRHSGLTATVVIKMACPAPITPTSTGHPRRGQTVTVEQPAVISSADGNTGANGDEIGAFFYAPPPGAGAATSGPVIFHRYLTKPIPTSEVLPCSGSGDVTFVALPMSPGSEKDVVIPVRYVS